MVQANKSLYRRSRSLRRQLFSQQALADALKREVVQALTTVAEQAPRKPDERSTGTLKAIMGYIPTAISSASQLTTLWEKLSPTIKGYLGV